MQNMRKGGISDKTALLGFGTVSLLLGIFIFYGGLNGQRAHKALDEQGQTVQGVVTGRWVSGKQMIDRSVRFSYEINHRKYEGSSSVNLDTYLMATPGAMLSVRYLPNDPGIAQLALSTDADANDLRGYLFIPLAGMLCLLGITSISWPFLPKKRLSRNGVQKARS
jgi:hypothetical protein